MSPKRLFVFDRYRLDEQERQTRERERDHLRARAPDGIPGDHREHHAAAEDERPGAIESRARKDAEHAQPAHHAEKRDDGDFRGLDCS